MIGSCSDDSDPQWLLDVTSKSGGATSFLLDQEPVTGPQIWFWDADRGGDTFYHRHPHPGIAGYLQNLTQSRGRLAKLHLSQSCTEGEPHINQQLLGSSDTTQTALCQPLVPAAPACPKLLRDSDKTPAKSWLTSTKYHRPMMHSSLQTVGCQNRSTSPQTRCLST